MYRKDLNKISLHEPPENWFETWFNTKYYHILYKNRDFNEAKLFIGNLVNFLSLPKNSKVMDVACGKGRHSFTLNQLGLNVTGIDLSEESINEAKNLENETLSFYRHDMREAYPTTNQDAIFNLFTSFGYFNNITENELALQHIYNALKPEGLFIFDYLNANLVLKNLVKEEIKEIDGIQFFINRYLLNQKIVKRIKVIDNGTEQLFFEQVNALFLNDLETLLSKIGFKINQMFGDYNLAKFNEDTSSRLIIIAQK
jgi:SAM-dependent methyltransferase